jgi:polar amino acid transport system ATP-binding protein
MIHLIGLSKRYQDLAVLENLNAEIRTGECVAVIGPSGVGKSVLFRTIARLEEPDAGSIVIDGVDISAKGIDVNKVRQKMGMVYQGFHLFSHLNVMDNITLAPRKVLRMSTEQAEKKALELLALVGLVQKARAFPHQLSGGQQQRIAIARCLAVDPQILMFDEPTSALDPVMTDEVLSVIKRLVNRGLTILINTHEMNFAREVADRVLYMDERGIYEQGTPAEIFDHPQREKTRAFLRKLNLFKYTISSHDFDFIGMSSAVGDFCRKNRMDSTLTYRVQLVLEELIVQILSVSFRDSAPEISYSIEAEEGAKIELSFKAPSYDPLAMSSGDEEQLGMVLVRKMAATYEHIFASGINTITLTV